MEETQEHVKQFLEKDAEFATMISIMIFKRNLPNWFPESLALIRTNKLNHMIDSLIKHLRSNNKSPSIDWSFAREFLQTQINKQQSNPAEEIKIEDVNLFSTPQDPKVPIDSLTFPPNYQVGFLKTLTDMMNDPSEIDRVKQRTGYYEIIGQYVEVQNSGQCGNQQSSDNDPVEDKDKSDDEEQDPPNDDDYTQSFTFGMYGGPTSNN